MLQNKKIRFLTYLFGKKSKKLQWRLWEKFKNSLNCHNFRCVQDKVVTFGSRIWFSGSA